MTGAPAALGPRLRRRATGWCAAALGTARSDLPPQLTLMAKLLLLCLWIKGLPFALPEPFAPFHPVFDALGQSGLFRPAVQAAFVLGTGLVVGTRRVRTGCLLAGAALLLSLLASKHFYTNGKVFWACLLILLGLQARGQKALWLRLQLAVVYFGATFSKAMDPDWRSGQFFESWMHVRLEHEAYAAVAALLPQGSLSWLMCWTVIVSEAVLCVLLLLGERFRRITVWGVILFHTGLLFVLWGDSFGHFYYGAILAMLVLTPWPDGALVLHYPAGRRAARAVGMLRAVDWDRRLRLRRAAPGSGLRVELGGEQLAGFTALRCVVLHLPFFYYALLGAVLAARAAGRPLVVAVVIALFLPVVQGFWSRRLARVLGAGA